MLEGAAPVLCGWLAVQVAIQAGSLHGELVGQAGELHLAGLQQGEWLPRPAGLGWHREIPLLSHCFFFYYYFFHLLILFLVVVNIDS